MKFAEAALFRLAVASSGRVRSGIRQGRADARFVRGVRLGKTTDTGVYTTRTVKRVPDTEQRRADLVKSLQGTPWDRLAGRPAGRPCKTAPQAPPVATRPVAEASGRPSEDASERRSAKGQDFNPPVIPLVIPVPRAAEPENEPTSASGPMDMDHGGAQVDPASDDHVQVRSSTPAPSSPDDQTKRSVQPASRSALSKSNMSSGVKRDARAAEHPDEDEKGGKVQQVEGLTRVAAEDTLWEFSMEDDCEVNETAEGVDEETVKAILAGKKKELDAVEAFGIFDVCEELPNDAKITTTRWENVPKGDK